MKKIIALLLTLALCGAAFAQDARQRTVSTIVADVVAQMPAADAGAFASQMADLAASAPTCVPALAALLEPASQGVNNRVEYALNGLVTYVSDPAHADRKAAVLEGLRTAAAACSDETNKAFLTSLQRLISPAEALAEEPALSLKEAKRLMASSQMHERCRGTWAFLQQKPELAAKTVAKALQDGDRPYANAVLGYADELGRTTAAAMEVKKVFRKLDDGAKTDVVNWIGRNGLTYLQPFVTENIGSADRELSRAAILAAGKIGEADVVPALIAQLGGEDDAAAFEALSSFKGGVSDYVSSALDGECPAAQAVSLLKLASRHHMTGTAPRMMNLCQKASDASVAEAAARCLKGVVSAKDVPALGDLLDGVGAAQVPSVQDALVAALGKLPAAVQYPSVKSLMDGAEHPDRYLKALAASGTDAAVQDLQAAYAAGTPGALDGLLSIDNAAAAPALLALARKGSALADQVLPRYVSLLERYEKNPDKRRFGYAEALQLAGDAGVRGAVLSALGNFPTMKSFLLAGKYLDEPSTAYAAATAVKNIAAKTTEEIDYATLKTNLEKAAAIFGSTGNADDGYAVDEIRKMLSEAEPSPLSALTAEERKAGYEMLFDGTDLSAWQGDFEGYTPVNGAIYVSAGFGATGNLYTRKEYRDFVLRFEFCFLREGVNNGVGIRTPMGVDAAYEGMCEVQILDHDAPMYKGLNDYQVHGSAYGIIPAKRLVHKPLGEWSTEEIVVRGDRVKVTVNDEVILDGNLRTACKGHNVAPDGSGENPYTVDHRNHPGLFNKKGYISFCGHGEGLKLRNIRVLDLSK